MNLTEEKYAWDIILRKRKILPRPKSGTSLTASDQWKDCVCHIMHHFSIKRFDAVL